MVKAPNEFCLGEGKGHGFEIVLLFRKAVAVVQEEMGNGVISQCSLCGSIRRKY